MESNIKIYIQLRKEELYGQFRSMKFKFFNNLIIHLRKFCSTSRAAITRSLSDITGTNNYSSEQNH